MVRGVRTGVVREVEEMEELCGMGVMKVGPVAAGVGGGASCAP
jgi:hypothetical protein